MGGSGSDGSITINTKLDTKGFDAGSKRLIDAIRSFTERVSGVGDGFEDAFSAGGEAAVKSAEEYEQAVKDFAKTCEQFDGVETYEEAAKVLDDLKNQLTRFAMTQYSIDGKDMFGIETDIFPELESAFMKLRKVISETHEEMGEGSDDIDAYIDAVQCFAETCASFDTASIEEAEDILADLEAQLEEFGSTDFNIDGHLISGSSTPQFQQMSDAIQTLRRELDIAAHGPEWVAFRDRWGEMATLSGGIKSAFVSAFQGIRSAAGTAAAGIGTVLTHPLQALDRGLAAVASAAAKAGSAMLKIPARIVVAGLKKIAETAKNAARNLLSMASGAITNGFKSLIGTLTGLGRGSNSATDSFSSGIKTIIQYAAAFFSLRKIIDLAKEGFGNLIEQDASLRTTFNNFQAALETLKNSLAAAFAPIAQIVLPLLTSMINTISAAISKIGQLIAALTGQSTFKKANNNQINTANNANMAAGAMQDEAAAAKEAQKALAGFDDVEILHDNSTKLDRGQTAGGGTPGSAFSDLPIDNKFKDLANWLKDMWKNADFTELGKMLGEKLKNALESIPWDKIKNTARKLGKSVATLLNGFLEVPGLFTTIGHTLAEGLNTAFEYANAFVTNFHWDSLGTAIKDLIIGALEGIDWPLIYDTMAKFGEGIGTTLDTALNNPEIWTKISLGLDNAVGAVLTGLDNFLNAVDWGSFGENIGKGLNTGIEAFPWSQLSDTLIDLVNSAFDLWYNFVTTFDFKKFGSHIGTALSDVIKGINWTEGGASVAQTINGLFDALNGFIESTDWKALGKAVIDTVVAFFTELDWGNFTETFSAVTQALWDTLTGAFQEVDWKTLPGMITDAIKEALTGYDFAGVANSVGEAIGTAFKTIIEIGGTLWETMKSFGSDIIEGGYEGIKNKILEVGEWIKENILTPFIEGFKAAFGISSPAEEMKPYGEYVIEGFLEGIKGVFETISDWVQTEIVDKFVDAVKSMFGLNGEESKLVSVGKAVIEGFKTGIKDKMEGIATWVDKKIVDPFVKGVKSMFGLDGEESKLVSVGKKLIEGFKKGLTDAIDGIRDWIDTNITGPIIGFFKDLFGLGEDGSSIFVEIGYALIDGLKAGLEAAMDGIKDWIQTTVTDPICNFFKERFDIGSPSKVFEGYGGYLMDGLKDGIENKKDTPTTALSNVETSMKSVFVNPNATAAWGKAGGSLMSLGLKAGISQKKQMLVSSVKDVEQSMRNAVTSKNATWKQAGTNLANNLKTGISSKKTTLVQLINTIISEMKKKMDSYKTSYTNSGKELMTSVNNGIKSMQSTIVSTARDISDNIKSAFDDVDWYSVGSNISDGIESGFSSGESMITGEADGIADGIRSAFSNTPWYEIGDNICQGIYNGMQNNWSWLQDTAYNLAVQLYNEACSALGIYSPSRKFRYVGEMLTEGLANGIDSTSDNAISAVTSLADVITEEAENTKPTMMIDAAIEDLTGGIDTVLASFSDKIISSFDSMITAMERIADSTGFIMPAVANGAVMPYSARRTASQADGDDLATLLERIALQGSDRLTREDLMEILTQVCRENLNIGFYIGDEQIARHANAGNAKLNRRYSAVSSM